MSMNRANAIKQILTMRQVAEFYGFHPNRAGYIQCPFHSGDKHGSLKIYPDTGGWHCFGCGAGGSVIDFAMRLFDINFKQAVLRLNSDFNLGLSNEKPDRHAVSAAMQKRREEQREAEKQACAFKIMIRELWRLRDTVDLCPPVRDGDTTWYHPLYIDAVKRLPAVENWIDEYLQKGGCTDWSKFQNILKMNTL